MAHVENIRVYPIKGLDPMDVESTRLTDAGTLEWDRSYAMVDPGAEEPVDPVADTYNGKEIDTFHELDAMFDPTTERLTLSVTKTEIVRRFDLPTERTDAGVWLGEFFGKSLELRRAEPPGFVDRPNLGPSVISTGTLEEIASWFEAVSVEGARRRLRPNIEIGGVPPFWEDRFLGDDPSGFEIGGVRFEGAKACVRCVVPTRDPETGEPTESFRQRFVDRREATLPGWVDESTLENLYSAMLITRVPKFDGSARIRVGEEVVVDDGTRAEIE